VREAVRGPLLQCVQLCALALCCRSACQQYWWERFPAQGGAATSSYMFAFTDPAPANAGLLQHMARVYAEQLPSYLGELLLCCCAATCAHLSDASSCACLRSKV
jgi:hypothetical protein